MIFHAYVVVEDLVNNTGLDFIRRAADFTVTSDIKGLFLEFHRETRDKVLDETLELAARLLKSNHGLSDQEIEDSVIVVTFHSNHPYENKDGKVLPRMLVPK